MLDVAATEIRRPTGRNLAGYVLPGFGVFVERDPVRRFARAIGDDRAECYYDVAAARRAGYADLVVPPTYLFSLELRRPDPYRPLDLIGAPMSAVLRAGQSFRYHHSCCAGDEIDFELRIASYREAREGRLGLIERHARVPRGGVLVAELTNMLAIRWDRA